jgi:WD40 repeat protein
LADIGEISEDETDLGAVADNMFENLVTFDEDVYSFDTYSNNELAYSGIRLVNNPDSNDWKIIGDIAIDSTNHRLAIIFQEGEVQLDTISHSDNTSFIPLRFSERLNMYEGNQPQEIQRSVFDIDGHWLAVVRGGRLAVWDVDGWRKKQLFSYEVGQIHGLSFDMRGDLLFVVVEDQILIFGLRDKGIISQLNAPNISTLCISEDNRLLFWGDDEGNIHVWGVKK